jgi:hypothetical protein
MVEIVTRQPSPPAQAQVRTDQSPGDTEGDGESGDPAEIHHLDPERGLILVLQAVVEAPVPFAEGDVDRHARQGEHDRAHEQGDGDPTLLRTEVRDNQPPPIDEVGTHALHAGNPFGRHTAETRRR